MTDLFKGVLGGGWSLLVGWILPVFLTLQLITLLVLPALPASFSAYHSFARESAGVKQLTLVGIAAVAGLVVAACQAPLYRLLEGYTVLWPAKIAQHCIKHHQARRSRLLAKQKEASAAKLAVRSGLLYERASRYPVSDDQFAPTLLGNAIRRFETYAIDRFKMDSQLLWNDLAAVAPAASVDAVGKARATVDFFVCLLYGAALTALTGCIVGAAVRLTVQTGLAIGAGVVLVPACYVLAVLATDEWDAAVRAVVDLGRAGVAAAFGLQIPDDLRDERRMWQIVNTLVRRPYSYSEMPGRDIPEKISALRARHSGQALAASGRAGTSGPGLAAVPARSAVELAADNGGLTESSGE